MSYAHYTTMGAQRAPHYADDDGFLAYRIGFESLDESEWTESEQWLNRGERSIEKWRAK